MKLSTCSLFGMIASAVCFLASDNLLVVASSSDKIVENVTETVENMSDLLVAASASDVNVPEVPSFDPDVTRLSLQGLDPSEPLTQAEAAFVETAIMQVFNEFHHANGIDLWADSVSVGTIPSLYNEALANFTANNVTVSNNLRGGRQLERTHKGIPGPDINYCHYRTGPKKGQWIPGCEFDITLYICCRCWLCQDDDWTFGWSWVPTRKPTSKPTMSADEQFLLWLDDDGYKERYPQKPTRKPTKAPTIAPTIAPTNAVVEEERGPKEPIFQEPPAKPVARPTQPQIHPRPPTNNNNKKRRRRNKNRNNRPSNKNFDQEVLKKLQNSPFDRLHKIQNVGFGYGN
mmetsp:Transcript_15921/g.32892  ORF Transcript_15921/g.32892 Transcript_15921/m.32892 type:complete len:345 (-) Transcript_15921:169-1203(-)|eukprot:CAMPEP_0197268690 /NCGR_PEP_ID=MMETSP1432-20130617/4323_1 /TAXON_ID=44447 /ORGANISM="Pseudo-nitzschia delicatissima, Strain UNC1205" /LENGTH=344 /DNA_ID=CAMNT_0042733767 /DNA_START=306 /DNA_END=1340 /DNA_ORIENTATION=+